jgi:hypothetical protein
MNPQGASVLVMETGNDVAVFVLHENPRKPVRIKSGSSTMELRVGKQMVLTRQVAAKFDQINPSTLISHKNSHSHLVAKDIRAHTADFSLLSAIMNVPALKNMLTASSAADRKMAQQMIKNAAVLALLKGQTGPYSTSGN